MKLRRLVALPFAQAADIFDCAITGNYGHYTQQIFNAERREQSEEALRKILEPLLKSMAARSGDGGGE